MYPLNDPQVCAWQNSVPDSTKFCRTIKFIFEKESAGLVVFETNYILEEISRLIPTKIKVRGKILIKLTINRPR